MRIKTLLLSAVLVATGYVAVAAEADSEKPDTLRLTLDKAIEIALNDNPTIKIADLEITRVDYSKEAAWWALAPTLSGTAQYTRSIIPSTMNMGGTTIKSAIDNTASASLSLSLPLIVPALWESIKLSKLDLQMAVEKSRASKMDMINTVKKAYYGHLLAKDSHKTLQESYDLSKQSYEDAKSKFEIGTAAEYDYVSAEVRMRNTVPNVLQAENGVKQSLLMLKVLLGLEVNYPVVVEGILSDFEDDMTPVNPDSSYSIEYNTDLIQIDLQQQQLQKQFNLQRTQRIPSLVAFGSYGYEGSGSDDDGSMDFGGMQIPVEGGMSWYGSGLMLGVRLNVPIFSGFSNTKKEKQLKIAGRQLDFSREYLQNNLNVQVQTSLDNMTKAIETVESSKDGLRLAQKGYDISQKRYETGGGTMLELNNAELALTQAKLTYSQSIMDYLNAKTDFEKILGIDIAVIQNNEEKK
jgi:outer membrane protein TolC